MPYILFAIECLFMFLSAVTLTTLILINFRAANERGWRFSLRTLLIAMTIVTVILGIGFTANR
jgi:hypothetical protein